MPSCTPQRTSTLVFCQEIESNQQLRDQYCRRVRNIAKWYKATFERYNTILLPYAAPAARERPS